MDTPVPSDPALYRPHARALTNLHADLEGYASAQPEVFVGTAGSVIERTNASGFRFFAHQSYDGAGKKQERYLAGPVGDPAAIDKAEQVRTRIRELKALVPSLRLLGREGYALVDGRTYATLASLHNHGVFAAGGVLIGSHAYGLLLNHLGIRAARYATEDVDIARREALAFERLPKPPFLTMLRESGIDFVEVPGLDRKRPSTSFAARGRAMFHVDLLVPSPNETFPAIAVPELGAHATGLPYLRYLLAEVQPGLLLAREGCCRVRVPLPERFTVHKLIVSSLRVGRGARAANDIEQACVLAAALAEHHPGALESAKSAVPPGARKHLRAGLAAAGPLLEKAHPRAWEELHQRSE